MWYNKGIRGSTFRRRDRDEVFEKTVIYRYSTYFLCVNAYGIDCIHSLRLCGKSRKRQYTECNHSRRNGRDHGSYCSGIHHDEVLEVRVHGAQGGRNVEEK